MVKEGLKKNPKFGWFLNNGFASDRDLGLCGRGQGWDDLGEWPPCYHSCEGAGWACPAPSGR